MPTSDPLPLINGAADNAHPGQTRSEFNLVSEAAPIIGLIRNIGTPVHLVGHSYGGGVALRIARELPELIRSLTLIEPSSFHLLKEGDPDDQILLQEVIDVAEAVSEAVSSGKYWSGTGHFVDYWSGARYVGRNVAQIADDPQSDPG